MFEQTFFMHGIIINQDTDSIDETNWSCRGESGEVGGELRHRKEPFVNRRPYGFSRCTVGLESFC